MAATELEPSRSLSRDDIVQVVEEQSGVSAKDGIYLKQGPSTF